MTSKHATPFITYGRFVDKIDFRSFVLIKRNPTCEKLVKKMMEANAAKSTMNKKPQKVPALPPEMPLSKRQQSILKAKTINDDEYKKHLDHFKNGRIESKITRYSRRCASLNTTEYEPIRSYGKATKHPTRKMRHRRSLSEHQSYKDENIAEPPRSHDSVPKEQYSTKDKHSNESFTNLKDNEVVKNVLSNDTISNNDCEDVFTSNKIVDSMKMMHSKLIKSCSDNKVFEDEEMKSKNCVEQETNESVEEAYSNESTMCSVLSGSKEDVNMDEELSELDDKADLTLKNPSENSVIPVDKLSDDCVNSDHENEKDLMIDECEKALDQKTEECDKSIEMTKDFEESAHQVSEDFEISVEQLTEVCDESSEQVSEEIENSGDQVTEELNEDAVQLSDYEEESRLIIEENNESIVQSTEEYNESNVEQSNEKHEESCEELNEEHEGSEPNEEHEKSSEELDEEHNETENNQIEEYNESVEQMTEECNKSAEELCEEMNETVTHETPLSHMNEDFNDFTDQRIEECNTTVDLINDVNNESAQVTEDYDKMVDPLKDEFEECVEESVDELTEDYEESVDQLIEEVVTSVVHTNDEYEDSEQKTKDYEESVDQVTEECAIEVVEINNDYEESAQGTEVDIVKQLSEECKKSAYQLSVVCDKSVEKIQSNEFVKSSVYTDQNVPDCHKYGKIKIIDQATLSNNNNVAGFDFRATENNHEKVISYERNSFSPVQDQTEDKAYNVKNLIDSLYINENSNSKSEPIDLVTTVPSFDFNQTRLQTPLQNPIQILHQSQLQIQLKTQLQLQTQPQTSIPPLKKRRENSSHDEMFIPKQFAIPPINSPDISNVIPTNNRIVSLEASLPYVSSPIGAVRAFNLLENLKAEQFYHKSKQQQIFMEKQMQFKKAFNYQVPGFKTVPNKSYMTGYDGPIIPKCTNTYYLPYDNRNALLMQEQAMNKVNVDTRNNTTIAATRSNLPNYQVINNYNSGCDINNHPQPGPSSASSASNKRKSNNVMGPIYVSRDLMKEPQHILPPNSEEISMELNGTVSLKDAATTQCSNFSEKFLPFKRRSTVRPRNRTRYLQEQLIDNPEISYPAIAMHEQSIITSQPDFYPAETVQEPITVNQDILYPVETVQEQSIVDHEISYPAKPMISIANTCTCHLQNYPSCSLHPRNFEPEMQAHNVHPGPSEGVIKPKSIHELLAKSSQRYDNNCKETMKTESYIDFNMALSDVAANEEVFDNSIPEFVVDESPGETGEFEEAYVNYEPTNVNFPEQSMMQSTISPTNPATKTTLKSVTKSFTKSVTNLTPYHYAMSPPNPPDSTTIQPQSCIYKKRGRPKGRLK